jgi:EAL domain-containing protein (putative c-di-GMP-specific phosphodiesterase class I)
LSLFYQPQFEIGSGNICGVEALARWFRADGGSIPPSLFIPMAEQGGMIGALGNWALREGCATAAKWHAVRFPAPICINVSALQICEQFTCEIAAALETSGLLPEQLELEITESVLLHNPDVTLSALAQWKSLGVRIAVDDFGTGNSGMSYLSKLPIDRLKIDRSIVRGIRKDSKESTMARAVVLLGKELGFTVLAEGVETRQQLRTLRELGCQQAQGLLLGHPLPAAEARRLMQGERVPHWPSRDLAAHYWTSRGVEPHRAL